MDSSNSGQSAGSWSVGAAFGRRPTVDSSKSGQSAAGWITYAPVAYQLLTIYAPVARQLLTSCTSCTPVANQLQQRCGFGLVSALHQACGKKVNSLRRRQSADGGFLKFRAVGRGVDSPNSGQSAEAWIPQIPGCRPKQGFPKFRAVGRGMDSSNPGQSAEAWIP